jgi:hypothetical protein
MNQPANTDQPMMIKTVKAIDGRSAVILRS